ncbi:MAG TPA: hypothetical protein DCS13_03730 [Candidatus Margulisbacteria bacterium]|nr:MAG: hypothetical protein A2X43_03820 [Candidatus Margulisbacteria bacterium GWD2_39_127]OGI02459.1 MAG: hypothetical protein A2X42_07225 [Candidatus Margulisbacteria bacterium GWF2_38_17]OGI10952.1 MAG: hypothetical protein A2X41_01750 [Candidatus Margulisbacteria bacterium GWE2_39_32]HAR62553.1 hypothetical protein [Candidatus Margulisiibacteriota bacterium]
MKKLLVIVSCLLGLCVPFVNAVPPVGIDVRQDSETGIYVSKGAYYQCPASVTLNGTISGVRYFYSDNLVISTVIDPAAIVVFGANQEIRYTNQFDAGYSKSITKIEKW